jgi:hypothetical protein
VYGSLSIRCVWDDLLELLCTHSVSTCSDQAVSFPAEALSPDKGANQFLENTGIERFLLSTAMPQLKVVVLQALPVRPELIQAVLIDVSDTAAIASR